MVRMAPYMRRIVNVPRMMRTAPYMRGVSPMRGLHKTLAPCMRGVLSLLIVVVVRVVMADRLVVGAVLSLS